MAVLYVFYKNHTDLTWRRPRYISGKAGGYTITPYQEIQEKQMDCGLEFIREGGCFDIEQTTQLREYLERNPDAYDEIRQMISEGRLRILGGGESVIDYNLPDGESIIRNHLYSRKWLKEEFGVAPKLADCPDTFGLSAGLPGLFRQLGYKGLLEYDRVFANHKPYWRGVSGDVVALDSARIPCDFCFFTTVKTRVCGICGGKGCDACGYSGMESLFTPTCAEDILALEEPLRERLTKGDAHLVICGEECMAPAGSAEACKKLAEKCGCEIVFTSMETYALEHSRALLDNADNPPEELVDDRQEGNPVATGCYTTRVRLKQENRATESALRSAERLSAMASLLYGTEYPAKTFEYWWRKLAFTHFHDAIPASHSDDAHEELMEVCRRIRAGVSRYTLSASRQLLKPLLKPSSEEGTGYAFAVMNPLEFEVKNARLTGVLRLPKNTDEGGYVTDENGDRYPCVSFKRSEIPGSDSCTVEFYGDLPPMGCRIFKFVPAANGERKKIETKGEYILENEHLRVEFADYRIRCVKDKSDGRIIASEGTFSPFLSDDAGHLWGRSNTVQYREYADLNDYAESMVPAAVYERALTAEKRDGIEKVIVRVRYARNEKRIHMLDWTAEFTLIGKELRADIHTSLDAEDIKLSARIHLPQAPKNGMTCEIPLGEVARGNVEDFDWYLGYADEWAALRYASADIDGKSTVLCNRGTAGHSIKRDTISVSLLRTPTQLCCGYGIENAIDRREHTFVFTLSAENTENRVAMYRRGMILNTDFPSVCLGSGIQPASETFVSLPDTLPLMAFKGAENGKGFIIRYLGTDKQTKLCFDREVTSCDVLEADTEEKKAEYDAAPYRIMTFRL